MSPVNISLSPINVYLNMRKMNGRKNRTFNHKLICESCRNVRRQSELLSKISVAENGWEMEYEDEGGHWISKNHVERYEIFSSAYTTLWNHSFRKLYKYKFLRVKFLQSFLQVRELIISQKCYKPNTNRKISPRSYKTIKWQNGYIFPGYKIFVLYR